ncbi:MAG: anaerobic sulfatase maturase [Planctomycetaceae bacterium]|nr:anaerobic sulfatase maturase [Planctomycetaceae bacterium]
MSGRDSRSLWPFHVMSKPTGPICNLDCDYCYYLEKENLYPGNQRWKMGDTCLEQFIRQYITAQPAGTEEVTFAWQGGEPTLLGIGFFQRCLELQRQFARPGMKVSNTIQTNGVLMDAEWCRFLRENGFLVGLSIDGPSDVHDAYRKDLRGQGTQAKVMASMHLMKRLNVEFNVLVAVHRVNAVDGGRVYRYLRDSGATFLQFIPVVERAAEGASTGEQVTDRSVSAEQWGQFLCDVFDEWAERDIGRVFVQIFDQMLGAVLGFEPSLCVFQKRCGRAMAVEHNGDVYCCDHFVDADHLLGNITSEPLGTLAADPRQIAFGDAKELTLPDECRACEVLHVCRGECPKNRFRFSASGQQNLNYLCAGYRRFFNHAMPVTQEMAALIRRGRPPAEITRMRNGKPPRSFGA